ncbi:helix-turn-helix domain-containing protein [Actinophytocola xanthii]|uniref:helix-turn-helix domain-containing protein n=1 Tax=Actinophytocola xanthii TaxID=1912961 RepID=UPI0018E95142|nr:helix-turn-helix transcriptional regulator [Actinophytocola xanthii]
MRAEPIPDPSPLGVAGARTLEELAALLRTLRRRHARRRRDRELSYREIAARTGWSHTAIGEYFAGRTLPPIDRFDALVALLGATPAEQGALATARDQVAENRRGLPHGRAQVRRLPVDATCGRDQRAPGSTDWSA